MGGKSYKAVTLFIFCWLASCVKDKPAPLSSATPGAVNNVYIVCEGNFGNGDATLYAFEPAHDSVFGDLYQSVNHQPLGDVFQSMTRIGSRFFLCINNSDKIVILNATNWTLAGTISIPKPRYILTISASKAYVSTEYSSKLYIINPQTLRVTGIIDLPNQNPEGMCLINNNAVIATWDTAGNSVFNIDVNTDQLTQTYKTAGYAPQEVLVDKEEMLWVLAGNPTDFRPCTWTRIDPSTGNTLKAFQFPAGANVVRPVFNNSKDTLYFIEANQDGGTANNGIYRMSIYDTQLPVQPFVAAKQYQYFWALGVEPATGNIYIGDPKGFIQKGIVYTYRPDGSRVDSFNVGLGPGHFYFDSN